MNLRGTLITVVDLSARLGDAAAISAAPPRIVIVVEGAGKRFGIGVESVQGVADVQEEALETLDAQRSSGGIVGALAKLEMETAQLCLIDAIAREALAVN
jgi:chemotaxis signal transduction protein